MPIQIKTKSEELFLGPKASWHSTAYLGTTTRTNESASSARKQGIFLSCSDIKRQDKKDSTADKYVIRSHKEGVKA